MKLNIDIEELHHIQELPNVKFLCSRCKHSCSYTTNSFFYNKHKIKPAHLEILLNELNNNQSVSTI